MEAPTPAARAELRQAVCGVLADCARLADENRPDDLADRFTPDCDVRYARDTSLRGREELLKYLRSALERYTATSHLLGLPVVTPDGPDAADAITTVRAWHRRPDGGETVLHGRYVDHLTRTGGQWLIATRELQVAGRDETGPPLPRAGSGDEVIVAGWIDWAPEDRHRALECFLEATGPTLAEPGCLAYTVTPDPGDPRRLHVFERWRSAASLDEHLATEHIATFRARSASLTRIGRGLYRFRVVDGEPMSSSRQSHAKES